MKKGLTIVIFFGILLLAFVYMSPVTPSSPSEAVDDTAPLREESETPDPDAIVDEALRQLESGEIPPMQGILKIRDVAEKYPGHVKSNFTLGALSMQTGQYEKAIDRFRTVLEKRPEDPQIWRLLAESQLKTGDTAAAQKSFLQALELADEETAAGFKKELPQLNSIN